MILRASERVQTPEMNVRGGVGPAVSASYLKPGDMDNVVKAGRTCLEPGSSIGLHAHPTTEEFWFILEGHGTVLMDGEPFPVSAGDLMLTKAGHSHSLINDSDAPLVYFGLLTNQVAQ